MKAATVAVPAAPEPRADFALASLPGVAGHPRAGMVGDFVELVKARLTALVLTTTLAGLYLGWSGPRNLGLAIHAMLGTALVAAGAAALNQLLERSSDARMRRTRDRPLPAGRMRPEAALMIGFLLAVLGLGELALMVNLLTAVLAAVTLGIYLFVYTPLKRVTTLNTLIGAIPGALPPMLGWTAARGSLDAGAWVLFGILFFWQLPHFLAIAWRYREDYARGGFIMLPMQDPDGSRTGRQCVNYSFALLLVSLMPTRLGLATPGYFFAAFALGAGLIVFAVRLQAQRTDARARHLFFASIVYLPLLLLALALGKAGG